jgi:hypothetical protein
VRKVLDEHDGLAVFGMRGDIEIIKPRGEV